MKPGTAFVDVVLQRFRERFVAKMVAGPEGCHIWTGARNPKGYGVIRLSGRTFLAHRVAYESGARSRLVSSSTISVGLLRA